MERSELAIIIPAYNEGATIGRVVTQAARYGTVIVVDDASSDDTARIANASGALVVRLDTNRGYDGALDSGFEKAAELGCRDAITLDADGQHDPSVIDDFKRALRDVSLVLGVRPRKQRLAETVFALVTHWLYGIRDPLCGMKGYRMELHQALGHFDSYGSIGTELALHAVRSGTSFVEINVPMRDRQGNPRFDTLIRANFRILRALVLALTASAKKSSAVPTAAS